MSVARITSGVFAGSSTSSRVALGTTRNAPPVPVALSWQPEPAQVLVAVEPGIVSCAMKIGLMHFWKYANDSFCPVAPGGFCTVEGLSSGFELLPPPQLASAAQAIVTASGTTMQPNTRSAS